MHIIVSVPEYCNTKGKMWAKKMEKLKRSLQEKNVVIEKEKQTSCRQINKIQICRADEFPGGSYTRNCASYNDAQTYMNIFLIIYFFTNLLITSIFTYMN